MKRLLILVLLGLILLGGNCTKNPNGPNLGRGPILYAITEQDGSGDFTVYLIDTQSDSLVDSMVINSPIHYGIILGLGVSPDGSKLYLSNGVIDTRTKSIISGAVTGVPTPDGKYLLVNGPPFRIYDANTDQLVFSSDSIGMRVSGIGSPFAPLRSLVFGGLEGRKIGMFDYKNFRLVKVIDPSQIGGYQVPVVDLVVTHDAKKLYYTSSVSYHLFTGIDLERDTVVALHLINSISFLGIRPDDKYIYLTDPGGYLIEPLPTEKIGVYSPPLETPLESIDLDTLTSPCFDPVIVTTDQIALSSDGRKAYVCTYSDCVILVIDTQRNELIKLIKVREFIRSLAIQRPIPFKLKPGG